MLQVNTDENAQSKCKRMLASKVSELQDDHHFHISDEAPKAAPSGRYIYRLMRAMIGTFFDFTVHSHRCFLLPQIVTFMAPGSCPRELCQKLKRLLCRAYLAGLSDTSLFNQGSQSRSPAKKRLPSSQLQKKGTEKTASRIGRIAQDLVMNVLWMLLGLL